jgi:hypothetical protein
MGWSGGNYSKGNAATGGWAGDASLGIGIEAGRHDTQDNDFATGINQCINKDGSNAFTANPNLGGFIPTNIAAGTAAAPALCVGGDVNTGVFGPAADTWAVATNGVERVRVDSSGYVGIGVTSPAVLQDSARSANDSLTRIRIQNANAGSSAQTHIDIGNDQSASAAGMVLNSSTNTAQAGANSLNIFNGLNAPISLRTNSAERISIRGNGDVVFFNGQIIVDATAIGASAGTNALRYSTTTGLVSYDTSSARYKDNIEPLTHGLTAVLAMSPKQYIYKSDNKPDVGFIAEEMVAVVPEVVSINQAGQPDAINYDRLVAVMAKAIQELNAKVETLEAQVEMLQTQVAIG